MNQHQLELQKDLYRLLLDTDSSCTDIDSTLSKALKLIVQITSARIGYIEVRNRDGHMWYSTYHCEESERETIRKRISTGIIAEAISTGETIITPSAFLDARFQFRDSVREERIESVLCSPFGKDGMVGVIYLQGEGDHEFDNTHCMMETELFAKHITPLLRQLHGQITSTVKDTSLRERYNLDDIIGNSTIFNSRLREAMSIAELDVTVLITGETGTGKGVLARAIHKNSTRKKGPFIHLNCANIPEQLAESELFGVIRGAHSSAYTDLKGKITAARGGVLFLDEIGELSLKVQAKLLQFLEEGTYYPLGSTLPLEADVRIITATNIDFKKAISEGSFREDLYYRLSVFPIEMPSLRQRKDDIPELVKFFVGKYCKKFNLSELTIDMPVLLALQDSDWSGNIRQLENKILQAVLRARTTHSSELQMSHVLPDTTDTFEQPIDELLSYRECKDDWERRFIKNHLEKNQWNVSETAKSLQLSRSHLNNLIKQHKLERKCPE